jgi:sodium/potassium-transporting ATPase subunit alpha
MASENQSEKLPYPDDAESHDEAIRAVAFPDNSHVYEQKPVGAMRPKGVDMKRELTMEDRELAAAGYEHLEDQKAKKGTDASKLEHVDIHEHELSFDDLQRQLNTSIDTNDASKSSGLSASEASTRLARDGRNILTPPKKKSALRKVRLVYSGSKITTLKSHYSISTAF